MKLVDNWRDALKLNSVQVFALLAILPPIWESIPPETKAAIPTEWQPWIVSAVAVIGALLRLRKQGA